MNLVASHSEGTAITASSAAVDLRSTWLWLSACRISNLGCKCCLLDLKGFRIQRFGAWSSGVSDYGMKRRRVGPSCSPPRRAFVASSKARFCHTDIVLTHGPFSLSNILERVTVNGSCSMALASRMQPRLLLSSYTGICNETPHSPTGFDLRHVNPAMIRAALGRRDALHHKQQRQRHSPPDARAPSALLLEERPQSKASATCCFSSSPSPGFYSF